MKKIYTLSTCSTSKRILNETGVLELDIEIQDIKAKPISEEELTHLRSFKNSYDELFSRRAQKYKSLGLKNVDLSEEDIKSYILSDYTFLKRPVVVYNNDIFVGNSKKEQTRLSDFVNKQKT